MPGDTKPHLARLAKRHARIRKAGNLDDCRRELWRAILCARDVLLDATTPEITLRAVHAMQQACSSYARLVEAGELEARMAEVEKQLASRNGQAHA